MKMTRMAAIAGVGLLALGGCDEGAATGPETMPEAADGRALFMQYCAACHGEDAKGEGPLARSLTKAPKDLTLISLRHGDRFPRAMVLSMIDGYARSDLDGPGMPEFGELLSGDEVPFDSGDGVATPTPWRMVALVRYLETVQQTR